MKRAKPHTSLKLLLVTIVSLFIFVIGISGLWLSYYSISDGILNKNMLVGRSGRYWTVEGNWAIFSGLVNGTAGVLILLTSLGVIAYLFATYDKKR